MKMICETGQAIAYQNLVAAADARSALIHLAMQLHDELHTELSKNIGELVRACGSCPGIPDN